MVVIGENPQAITAAEATGGVKRGNTLIFPGEGSRAADVNANRVLTDVAGQGKKRLTGMRVGPLVALFYPGAPSPQRYRIFPFAGHRT